MNKSYWQQFCFLLLFILGGAVIFSSIALIIGKFCFGNDIESKLYLYIIQSISMFGTFLVPSLLFSYFASKNCFSYNEADKKIISPKLIGYVVILSLFILPIITYLGYLNEQISLPESMQKIEIWMREMEESNRALMQTLTANSNGIILLINILAMALLPAIFEEFLFRGTLQQFFSKWFANKHVAIIVTAFIFSAIHFQFYGFIPRFLLGIYLGYLFVWGRSLWLPIVAHFMHNAISLILGYIARYRGIDLEAVDPSQITGFYPTVIFCTLFVGLGVYFVRRFSQISTENKSV